MKKTYYLKKKISTKNKTLKKIRLLLHVNLFPIGQAKKTFFCHVQQFLKKIINIQIKTKN